MKDKVYFSKEFMKFFMELAPNNNKDWFDANRERYQKFVKKPFEELVEDIIESMRKSHGLGDLKASECIFRINRDIRFSKDKTPYKIQMSALVTKGGRKHMDTPGLYLELTPEHLGIYTGFYMPDKVQLETLRNKIAADPKKFSSIIANKKFRESFGEVKGDRSKILPAGLKDAAKEQDLIFNKQFYVMHQSEPEIILEKGLVKHILSHYKNAEAFNSFLF